jgi:hypothetical protein
LSKNRGAKPPGTKQIKLKREVLTYSLQQEKKKPNQGRRKTKKEEKELNSLHKL